MTILRPSTDKLSWTSQIGNIMINFSQTIKCNPRQRPGIDPGLQFSLILRTLPLTLSRQNKDKKLTNMPFPSLIVKAHL